MGRCRLVQTAYFAPKGLSGMLYWYALYPLHARIFSRMVAEVATKSMRTVEESLAGTRSTARCVKVRRSS